MEEKMSGKTALVWFRQDLRLHDNESLIDAINVSDNILPIYVFDERLFFGKTRYGFKKIGIHRAKFLLESIVNLRKNLLAIGSNLVVRIGKPEDIIAQFAQDYNCTWVFCNRERTSEEVFVQDALESKLWAIGQEIFYNRGKMLYYTSDLPFPIGQTPDVFTQFRKDVEKVVKVREPLASPLAIHSKFDRIDWGEIPSLRDLNFSEEEISNSSDLYKGGEDSGLSRLDYYFHETKFALSYKNTRNELLGTDFSTHFSMWLSCGCLSPKLIFWELKKLEQDEIKNDSTYSIFFELLWRDYFRLIAKKYNNKIFKKGGINGHIDPEWRDDLKLFKKVSRGESGIPIIDANMIELNKTGFMSNRGRQLVASYIVNDLKINWQIGAEYFESLLIDYDPASNYGNWNYIAGVGTDPRPDRFFNIVNQARKYDPHADYVSHWIPALCKISDKALRHVPWKYEEKVDDGSFVLERDYFEPVMIAETWDF